jgi:glycerophosphoryl diester phosphodiesterase
MKLTRFIFAACAVLALASCAQQPKYATRVEKILAEMNDPESNYVMVISHRGDWRNYPENSIPAIESLIRIGGDMMELDVKMTSDSVLVLMHDKTVNRMTNGKGLVSSYTLDSLKQLRMRRAHNVTTDSVRVPTLREAFECCKDRILINVDHAQDYYKEIVELAEEMGMTGQVLMKGKKSIDQVAEDMAPYENNLLYMPIIDINKEKGQNLFYSYVERGIVPLAFEVCWQENGEDMDKCVEEIHKMGSKLWVNTFWPSVCGGFGNDDDAALDAENPADVYEQYLKMGATMIQTDRPEMLLKYLRSMGRHD